MWRINIILTLSFLVIALPFLGMPQAFDDVLYVVFGILIFISAFLLRKIKDSNVQRRSDYNERGELGEGAEISE
jgi:hypothetical protein